MGRLVAKYLGFPVFCAIALACSGAVGASVQYIDTTGTLTQAGQSLTIIEPITLESAWARDCNAGAHATCDLTVETDGSYEYNTGCEDGYVYYSGEGTFNPVCTEGVYEVTLRNYNNSATDGTIYEKYNVDWYSDRDTTIVLNMANVPERAGYTFRGYYTAKQTDLTQSGGSGTRSITNTGELPANTSFTEDTKLYAAWAKNCVTPEHGSCAVTVNDDGTVTYSASCDKGYSVSDANSTTPKCVVNSYTIEYDLAGGTHGAEYVTNVTYDTVFVVSNPTRFGYMFAGWTLTGMTDDVPHYRGEYDDSLTQFTGTTLTTATINKYFKNLRSSAGTVKFAATWELGRYTCSPGYYLAAGDIECSACTGANYCLGGTYTFNTASDSGITPCPGSYTYDTSNGKSLASQCGMYVAAGRYLGTANSSTTTACALGTYSSDGRVVFYGNTNSCTQASRGYFVGTTGATSQTPCAAGTYTSSTGQSSCITAVAGTYTVDCAEAEHKACRAVSVCADNSYSDAGASSCTHCDIAKGYYNNGSEAVNHAGLGSCKTNCPGGYYVASVGGACIPVGVEYYGVGGVVAQNEQPTSSATRIRCPLNELVDSGSVYLRTRGFGVGADSEDDCGHILHYLDRDNDNRDVQTILKRQATTDPHYAVHLDDGVWYANMDKTFVLTTEQTEKRDTGCTPVNEENICTRENATNMCEVDMPETCCCPALKTYM